MKLEEIIQTLGHPRRTEKFVTDRMSFEYLVGARETYFLSLTVHEQNGLIYIVFMNHQKTIDEAAKSACT